MTATPALRAVGLGRRFGRTWALRDCSIDLPEGCVAALVGPNGAGKSTLLELAVGLSQPTEGRIEVFGIDPVTDPRAVLAGTAFVAQDHALYGRMRVHDLFAWAAAMNDRWDRPLANRRIAELDIPPDRRVATLSGGQRAQVSMTLALAQHPRLLVLDEPVANLDPLARHAVMAGLMTAVTEEGITVVLSTHVVSELERACDHLVVLHEGRVPIAGDIAELLDGHRWLTGPATGAPPPDGSVSVLADPRRTAVLQRVVHAGTLHPRWQATPVTLEELILAYLAAEVAP